MRNTSFADFHCSLAQALEVMGDWWAPLIVRDVHLGVDRFDELATDLGISRNLLSTRLGGLVDGGVLERVPYSERPPRYRYVLTQAGRELLPILMALTAWGDKWTTPPGGPPAKFRHLGCGHRCKPSVTCSSCGEPLTADAVAVEPGPGGRVAPGTAVVAERIAASGGRRGA